MATDPNGMNEGFLGADEAARAGSIDRASRGDAERRDRVEATEQCLGARAAVMLDPVGAPTFLAPEQTSREPLDRANFAEFPGSLERPDHINDTPAARSWEASEMHAMTH